MVAAAPDRPVARLSVADHGTVWRWVTVFVTGGAIVGAAVSSPGSVAEPSRFLAWMLFIGSSVHVASTGWFATQGSVRRHAVHDDRRGLLCLPLCLASASVVVAMVLPAHLLGWILLGFFAWQFHHFQKQNLGLLALFSTSSVIAAPRIVERRLVVAAGLCGIAALIANPNLLQLQLYQPVSALTLVALAGYIAVFVAGMSALLQRPRHARPSSYCAMYATALLFPLPIFIFLSPYAAVGGMTIAHGLQYLILMALVAHGASSKFARRRELALLFTIGLVGGALLSVASHLHLSALVTLRGVFGLYAGLLCAHFLVDARLWRLSRPFPRAFLGSRLPLLFPTVSKKLDPLPIDR